MVVLDQAEAMFVVGRERYLDGWFSKDRSAILVRHSPQPAVICADHSVHAGTVLENHIAPRSHLPGRKLHVGAIGGALNPV